VNLCRRVRRWFADDRGLTGPAVAMLLVIVLMIGALVFDGGRALAVKRQTINHAEAAARAGAATATIHGLGGPAETATRDYLNRVGVDAGEIVAISITQTTVTVTLRARSDAVFGELAGVQTYWVSGTGEATARFGTGATP
jgi:Flp pilus assembly protein TadG